MIVIFDLNFWFIFKISIKNFGNCKIEYVCGPENLTRKIRIKIFILSLLRIADIETQHMRIQHILDLNQQSMHFHALTEAQKHSLAFTEDVLRNIDIKNFLPKKFVDNIFIYLAQDHYIRFVDIFRKITLIDSIFSEKKRVLYLNIDREFHTYLNRLNLRNVILVEKTKLNFTYFKNIFRLILNLFYISIQIYPIKSIRESSLIPSILVSERNEIHFQSDIRNEQYWFLNPKFSRYNLFCLLESKNYKLFLKNGLRTPSNIFVTKLRFVGFRKNRIFNDNARRFFLSFFIPILKLNGTKLFFLFSHPKIFNSITLFLIDLIGKSDITKRVNCRIYLYNDPHNRDSHVLNSIEGPETFKTFNLQYSNMSDNSLLMVSNPSALLSYSSFFDQFYSNKDFSLGPKRYRQVGFTTQGDLQKIQERANKLKDHLSSSGIDFVIGYFDENVQEDSDIWAFKTKSEQLYDIHLLCNLIFKFPNIGIVYKNQFVRKHPTNLFPNDHLISRAIKTGRFLIPNVSATHNRNLVLPSEIGMVSNICIGDLVGATASLEAALVGSRSILINSMNVKTTFRKFYFNSKLLVYPNLTSALNDIEQYLKGDPQFDQIGKWDDVLKELNLTNYISQDLLINELIENMI
jgi:hypothetical protein